MNDKKGDPRRGNPADSEVTMTLSDLPTGGVIMTKLIIGDPNHRYWHHNERGDIVWEAHPEGVTIPDGVTVIGQLSCPMLGSVTLAPSVREIGDLAFGKEFFSGDTYEWLALETVHFSTGLVRIGYRAFCNCHRLDGVRLPKGLREIEEDAFRLCLGLSRITIPESVEHLGSGAFAKCRGLKRAIFRDGCISIGRETFLGDISLKAVVLPATLESIGYKAFSGCSALEEINIPDTLTALGGGAFEDCVSLKSLSFNNDLQTTRYTWEESPFLGCTALTEITLGQGVTRADQLPPAPALREYKVPKDHPLFTSIDGVLYSKDKRTLLRVPAGLQGEFTIPRGVTEIGANALRGCDKITEVILPSSLTVIESGAFAACSALRSVTLTGKLTKLGECAFRDCRSLKSAYISASVRSVGEGCFDGCDGLESLTVSAQNRFLRAEGIKLIPRNS